MSSVFKYACRVLKQQRREQRTDKKQQFNKRNWAKQWFCWCITRSDTFLCRLRASLTWNFLFSRRNKGGRQLAKLNDFFFPFSELGYSPPEFNLRQIRPYLNWARLSSSAIKFNLKEREFSFQVTFRCPRYHGCLSSLLKGWVTKRPHFQSRYVSRNIYLPTTAQLKSSRRWTCYHGVTMATTRSTSAEKPLVSCVDLFACSEELRGDIY